MKSLQTVPVLYKSENEYILHHYIVSSSVEILDCEPPQDRLWMVRGAAKAKAKAKAKSDKKSAEDEASLFVEIFESRWLFVFVRW